MIFRGDGVCRLANDHSFPFLDILAMKGLAKGIEDSKALVASAMDGFKASLVKDTSANGLWTVSFCAERILKQLAVLSRKLYNNRDKKGAPNI